MSKEGKEGAQLPMPGCHPKAYQSVGFTFSPESSTVTNESSLHVEGIIGEGNKCLLDPAIPQKLTSIFPYFR